MCQTRGCTSDDAHLGVCLQVVEWGVSENLLYLVQLFGLSHHKLLEGGESRHPEYRGPVDAGEVAHQFVVSHLVVVGIDVAQFHHAVTGPSNALLDGIHFFHKVAGLCLVIAQGCEHALAVCFVCLAHHLCLRVVVEVVVAIAQSKSCLGDTDDVVVGIAEVGTGSPGIHHRRLATTVYLCGDTLVFLAILHGTNLFNVRHDGCQSLLVTLQRVHHLVVERTNLIAQRTLFLWLR